MRRIGKIIVSLFALISAILFVALVALWIRSYFVGEILDYCIRDRANPIVDNVLSVRSGQGGVRFTFDEWGAWEFGVRKPSDPNQHSKRFDYRRLDPYYPYALNTTGFKRFGFEWSGYDEVISNTSVGSGIIRERNLIAPYWSLVVVTIPLPLIFLFTWKKQRTQKYRLAQGFCIQCGYDLRATPGQCPECGTITVGSNTKPGD